MRIHNAKIWLAFSVFVAALLAVPGVQAKKPVGDKPDKPGSGVEYKTTTAPNWAYWDSHYIYEVPMGPRYCGEGGPDGKNPQGGYGYVCHEQGIPMPNEVRIDLTDLAGLWVSTGRESDLCVRLDSEQFAFNVWNGDEAVSPSYKYFYSMDPTWIDGPCVDTDDPDTCWVRSYTQAYFWNECDDPGKGRLIELEGWGYVEPYGLDGDVYEANAFRRCQDIPIKQLIVKFRGCGRDKVVAECIYNFGDPVLGPIVGDDVPYFKTRTLSGYDAGFCD